MLITFPFYAGEVGLFKRLSAGNQFLDIEGFGMFLRVCGTKAHPSLAHGGIAFVSR